MYKSFFLKKRNFVALTAIFILLALCGFNAYLPISPGIFTQTQIDKIQTIPPSDHFSFAAKRYVVTLTIIIILLALMRFNAYLPIGPGNYNQTQIDKIHSIPPSDHFSFAVMGDSGHGFKIFKMILDSIDSNHYLFALINGDFVLHGRKDNYRAFFHLIKNKKTPFLTAIGNHDLRHGSSKNYSDVFGKTYYSFCFGNSLFIILNVALDDRIDAMQMKWLEEQLQKYYKHKFVFFHVPPFDPRPGKNHSLQDETDAKDLMALIEKYKPDIVFNSHIHGYFDEMRSGVNYVITGGAGQGLKMHGISVDHHFHHYVKVDVEGDKVSKVAIHLPYKEIDSLMYHWWDGFYNFWVRQKLSVILYFTILILLVDVSIGAFKRFTGG